MPARLTAPIFRVIREAAASDPEIAGLERTRTPQRLNSYTHAARIVVALDGKVDLDVRWAEQELLEARLLAAEAAVLVDVEYDCHLLAVARDDLRALRSRLID